MRSAEVRIEVGEAIGAAIPQQIAGTVYWPDNMDGDGRDIVIFASPGGGYSQHYFNMSFPGHEGYSEAEYHTSRGIVFVAMDHLAVGESSLEMVETLTFEQACDANDAFVRVVMQQLRVGTVSPDLRALNDAFVVGIGQSMGGGVTMGMQSRKETFDAIVPMGKSALHTSLPQPTFELFEIGRSIFQFSRSTPLAELSIQMTSSRIPDFVYPFHWPDTPQEIVAADMEGGYPARDPAKAPKFGSVTTPRYAVAMMSPAYMTSDAARIKVPVMMVAGERDTLPDPRREPTAFLNSSDVSVFIVPRMAHMHNFAPTRRLLWQRVADWSMMQARREAG